MRDTTRSQISALSKDQKLLDVLTKLCDRFGECAFDVVDHWEGYLHGVGLARTDDRSVLVYIGNFDMPDGTYTVELERAPAAESEQPYTVVGTYDSVSFEMLCSLVEQHFELDHR